jgi:NitT/TauT family transport system substrate-binding protein
MAVLNEKDFYLLQEIIKNAGELNKIAPYEKVVTKQFGGKSIKNIKYRPKGSSISA